MKNSTRKSISALMALTMANPIFAAEECSFSHTMAYENEPIYDQTSNLGQVGIHLMLETSALLFRRMSDGGVLNELAHDISYSNDGTTMVLTLRDDCGWSDGAKITAYDIAYGIQRVFAAGFGLYIPGRNFIEGGPEVSKGAITPDQMGVRATAPNKIEIDMSVGSDLVQQALSRYNFSPYPLHLSQEERVLWEGKELARLSSGPYMVTSMDDKSIRMIKNPHYCAGIEPQIETINVFHAKKSASQIGLWFNETINVAERFATRDHNALRERAQFNSDLAFNEVHMNDEIVEYLTEAKNSRMQEYPELREALFMAIDREQITSIVDCTSDDQTVLSSLSHPYEEYSTRPDELFQKGYDERVKIARTKMLGSGFDENNKLKLSMAVYKGFNDVQVANAIAAMWSQINVDLEIVDLSKLETSSFVENTKDVDYKITVIGSDYSDPSDFLLSVALFGEFQNSEDYIKKIDETFLIRDHKKRWEALSKIDEEFLRTRVSLPLAVISTPWILNNELEIGDYFNLTAINLKSSTCQD